MHISGHPGSGKSVMASFLVRHLEDMDKNVQFFFFRFDSQQTGKSIRHCLLSLAYQLAISYPEYGRRLKAMLEDRRSPANADVRRLWQKAFVGIFSKLEDMEPIYWVIDALDESDSVQLLVNLLPSLQTSKLPVRILFLTRPHTVGRAFDKLRLNLPADSFSSISMATPQSGLSLYVSQELQFTKWPGDPELMQFIMQSLLDKCRGNFLWLRLVLKELGNCDYQHEALLALEETPPELAAVYGRIEAQLAREMRPDSRDLAIRILSWITCSERQLTLEELAEGLKPHLHAHPMLHPQKTIDRLCGDLVVVDAKNQNVSMVHHTAQEFLTQTPDSPLHIDTAQAHTLILQRCLVQLNDPKFRLRVKMEGCRGFLQYACTSWSHHLALANVEDVGLIASLGAFLQSSAVLSWIDAACQLGQLRILTTTAKNINTFRDKRRKFDARRAPITHFEKEMEAMEQWSSDFVHIVGKFGQQLIQHPAAIHTLVPVLCPPESAISSQFLSSTDVTPMVSGLKNRGWDDSLASFSVGHDCQPTSIPALEDHFSIHSQDDTVSLYNSSVFQKLRHFCHEEVIVALNFGQDGDKLVTCGTRTIKQWDVSTGRLLDYYPNPSNTRAVAVSLNHKSRKILLCCTDGKIMSQELGSPENWQVVPLEGSADGSLGDMSGTPCAVSFSPDATKLAMAFRGRSLGSWNTETGRLIGRCQRRREGALSNAKQMRPYPQRLTWGPIHEHVLGIYNDGIFFKWNLVDIYAEELGTPIKAHEVVCSPDGRFVVTASGDGSLHVWHYDSMRLIYHLSCTSPVTSISVSADARRIYDLRESFCNVWEPNSLIRLAESEEKTSETSSQHAESIQISLTSEFRAAIPDAVTALAVGTSTSAYCFANDNGELTLQPSVNGDSITMDSGYIGATYLAFNHDDTMIACAELEGSVTIRRAMAGHLEPLSDIVELNPGSLVQQLLFTGSDSRLIIKSADNLSLWDSTTGSLVANCSFGEEDYRVILHPQGDNRLLSISASTFRILSSKDLSVIRSGELGRQRLANKPPNVAPNSSKRSFSKHNTGRSDTQSIVGEISVRPGQSQIFVEILNRAADGGGCDIDFFLLDIAALRDREGQTRVEAEPLPPAILRRIEIPLGFVWEGGTAGHGSKAAEQYSLAFLDVDFWVCTWSLSDTGSDRAHVKRHFFLPNDWINLDCLDMATVTPDGKLFCPRNGEVAMVSGGFNSAWLE